MMNDAVDSAEWNRRAFVRSRFIAIDDCRGRTQLRLTASTSTARSNEGFHAKATAELEDKSKSFLCRED
jgi:hypothetical protein